jgi:hypothetical protein
LIFIGGAFFYSKPLQICINNFDRKAYGGIGNMPIFEFECPKCESHEEFYESFEKSELKHPCCKCKTRMVKLFVPSGKFKLMYDPKKDIVSWGNEGYAVTQRYRETNKQAKHNIFPMPVAKSEG